ncbi:MAG: hypothetical protein GF317_01705, partial [Candidatus Lokiarchaeota archaeon]|nr:hypothetical protein [Candidatus Lokiarchaeota archaeon]MBD3198656.1 hypothetical protein [Candidatus Lokiarchaeota archaeon]
KAEIKLFPEEEEEEVRYILKEWGFKGELLDKATKQIVSNEDSWIDFLTKSELGLEEPESPALGAFITLIAFIAGSLITLFPYFINLGIISLVLSSVISFSMLFIVGVVKTRITGENKLRGGVEMLIVGTIAFLISYFIGTWMEQIVPT